MIHRRRQSSLPYPLRDLHPRADQKRYERIGKCLMAEREHFLELLGRKRRERAHLEAFACSLIQAAYRGYLLRNR